MWKALVHFLEFFPAMMDKTDPSSYIITTQWLKKKLHDPKAFQKV